MFKLRSLPTKITVLLIAALALLTTRQGTFVADAVAAPVSSARGGATGKTVPLAAKPALPKEKQKSPFLLVIGGVEDRPEALAEW